MLTRKEMTGPWAGLPVAWDEDLSFDEPSYRTDLARTCEAGAPGVYTAGTTGEFYAMELDEWKTITDVTVDAVTNLPHSFPFSRDVPGKHANEGRAD